MRRFLVLFLPLAALVGSVLVAMYYSEVKSRKIVREGQASQAMRLLTYTISNALVSIRGDLIFLSQQNELHEFLATDERERRDASAKVEQYIESHSAASFTHSLCPKCLAKHYPEDPA